MMLVDFVTYWSLIATPLLVLSLSLIGRVLLERSESVPVEKGHPTIEAPRVTILEHCIAVLEFRVADFERRVTQHGSCETGKDS